MSSSYLKNDSENVYDLNTERKLRQYILDTIESFRKNKQLSNVSRGYNPRTEPDDSSSEEEEDDDDYSDLWVNTNHIGEDVSDEDVSDEDVGDEDVSDNSRIAREEADRALLDYELYFWETDEFKNWLIEHNRLLKHYISEGSLYNAIDSAADPREFEDIDIWEDLLDEKFMDNLYLDYSENSFNRLYFRYADNKRITRPGYNDSGEKKLLFIHMYLREAFLARHELRNIDFRKKLCLLADERKLVYLSGDKDKKRYIRTPEFYYQVPYNYYPSSYQTYEEKCVIFDIPQNPELLRKEYTIATGYDNILEEVMDMILLARERNISTPLTTTEFASQLLTLKPDQIHTIHKKLQKILLE
jgi:hypothetical protein